MNFKHYNNAIIASWIYLPDTATLTRYLGTKDLIELSKCSKRYRNQLEYRVLEELDLSLWYFPLWTSCCDLCFAEVRSKTLGSLKSDLGIKLNFAKRVTLNCDIHIHIAKEFIKLLPNIKSLKIFQKFDTSFNLNLGLITILNGMEHLKSVEFINVLKTIGSINSKTIIFPKMLKSLKIINHEDKYKYSGLTIYDTIDPSYINLISLTVVSNRMIQNLAFGIPSLQDVEIEEIDSLDTSKLVAFLKANPQIKKLSIRLRSYKKVILECILYSKNLEHLCINHGYWRGIEVNNHQSNYSIKYLKIYGENLPAPTNFQLISACKNLETLDIDYGCFEKLDLLKFKKKINVLKLSVNSLPRSAIKKIDTSRLFNKVHLYTVNPNGEFIYQFNFYKLILLISEAFIFELIN